LLFLLLVLTANGFIPSGSVLQCKRGQYNTIKHITHRTNYHRNSICKITRKYQWQILYAIKTQKLVEPKIQKSVLKITRYIKQRVNHSTQYTITHISPTLTPHSNLLPFYTIHSSPCLDYFPSLHLADFHLTSNSFHLTYQIPAPILEILYFHHTSNFLYFTSLNTYTTFSSYILDFPILQNPFTSLHVCYFNPCSWKYSIPSVLQIHFTSLITI
jgi:hypothetical protein